MGKFSYHIYDNAYSIGNIDANNTVTGFGYSYYIEEKSFTMGKYIADKANGWMCSTVDNDKAGTVYFRKYKNDKRVAGITMISDDDCLDFSENINGGEYVGYNLLIWDDGSWRYQYLDNRKKDFESKAVQFYPEDDSLKMTYRLEDENEWEKVIGEGEITDFAIPFHRFQQKNYPKVELTRNENCVWSKTGGPIIMFEPKDGSTTISTWNDKAYNGLWYCDQKDRVVLTQVAKSQLNGGHVTVYKDTCNFRYTYFTKGKQCKIEVFWFRDTCTLEVRKYCYDDTNFCDMIQIDKDLNVWFAKKWNFEEKKAKKNLNYNWDEEYTGVVAEESEDEAAEEDTSSTKKVKKTAKTKKIENKEWTDDFRDLFK